MTTKELNPDQIALYPLLFEPIYQYRPWGGLRLSKLLKTPLPGGGPIGEAWLLSDRDDFQSIVGNGPLEGQTIRQLLKESQKQLLGKFVADFKCFPLLLKFLDAHEMLSVQVHPSEANADLLPAGETAKSEAWVVLEAGKESRIYAGLKPDTTKETIQKAISNGTVEQHLASFTPKPGDAIFLPAGTVHALGGDVVVFEIQQNSDVTFRLYDWNHIDARTGHPRELQIDKAIDCIDFKQGMIGPVIPQLEDEIPVKREMLFKCEHFGLWRVEGDSMFIVGVAETPRILVCLTGEGQVEHDGTNYPIGKGDVMLLPAVVGACFCQPKGEIILLEISLPENK
ncbi:MAG TPA: type I phosphomannose isomerase catalytic subunit [Bacteroidales bacterium]